MEFHDYTFYEFTITVDKYSVSFMVDNKWSETAYFRKEYPSFDTVIGVAFDRNSSTHGFFNIEQIIY